MLCICADVKISSTILKLVHIHQSHNYTLCDYFMQSTTFTFHVIIGRITFQSFPAAALPYAISAVHICSLATGIFAEHLCISARVQQPPA